jgi:hypothetical protein
VIPMTMSQAHRQHMSSEQLLDMLHERLDAFEQKLESICVRLTEGDLLFKGLVANQNICLRGLQALLIEKAAYLRVQESVIEVTDALKEIEERDTIRPSAGAEPTNPDNPKPEPPDQE